MKSPRKSIHIEGFGHGANPIPAASVAGGLLMSGAIFGMDPATRRLIPEAPAQCARMFEIAQAILQAGGSSWNQVLKMNFFVTPEFPREMINAHWVRLFPNPDSRPARHIIVSDRLPPGMHLQCDLTALVEDGF